MRKASFFARLAFILSSAVPLLAQPTTWRTQFDYHSYNISAGGFGGYTTTSTAHVPLPFSVTQSGDTATGTLEVKYPDSLPEGSFSLVGNRYYFVLSSPVKVGFHLEFDYVAARVDPSITVPTYLNLEISSGSDTDNPPCKLVNEQRNLTSGTTTHFVKDFECTFSKVGGTVGDPNVGGQVLTIANYIDFITFPRDGFGGFLATVYSQYRTLDNSDVREVDPGVISNDPSHASETVRIKIRGQNFEPGSTVSLGEGIRVVSANVNSPTEIEAVIGLADGPTPASGRNRASPAAATEGPRDVTVTKPGGAKQVGKDLFYVTSLAPAIEVNQGVPMECDGSRPCVANHDTWIRVRLPCSGNGCEAGKGAVTGRLHVFRPDASTLLGSPFRPDPPTMSVHQGTDSAFDRSELRSGANTLNFRLTADKAPGEGTYDFVFEIDPRNPGTAPSGNLYPIRNLVWELKEQHFRRSRSDRAIHVAAVIDTSATPRTRPIDPLQLADFTRAAFPISQDLLTIAPATFQDQYGPEVVPTLKRLKDRAAAEETVNGRPTYVVMFTTNILLTNTSTVGASSCSENTFSKTISCWGRSSLIAWEIDDSRASLAHELGHHQLLGDTHDEGADFSNVNPKCGGDGCSVQTGHLDPILANFSVDLARNDPNFGAFTKRDIMGNTHRPHRWIDKRTWDYLYDRFMPGPGTQKAALQERWLVVRGTISAEDVVSFEPFLSYTGVETGPGTNSGQYRVELQDAQGASVSSKSFPDAFKVPHSTQLLPAMPFDVTVLFPASATRVVVKKEGREIGSRPISAHPPTVTVTSPNGGETIGASTTITWTASDADGDALTFSVLYSPDGTKWSALAADLTGSSFAWTTAMAPGSQNARVMVIANDGVNSTSDTSDGPFTLAAKAPLVTFTSPADGAAFPVGQPVTLSGFAYDLEDGELPGSSLSYSSDRSGALGTGSSISTANLGAGAHTITLRAVDREGTPSTAQIHVTVFTPGAELNVVPVVGSTPGSGGSFFKTAVQIHNPTSATIAGNFVYHPQGQSGSPVDPTRGYMLLPGQTIGYADLLPELGQSGLGTVDLIATLGPAPTSVIRIFNDGGAAGTTGMTEEPMKGAEALEPGETGILIAPPEPSRARFNIGVRSLAGGATIRFTVRDAAGAVRTTGSKFLPPVYFAQQAADAFLGIVLLPNDTVAFEVDAGSVIVYGATTDNTTQDPSLQFARPLGSGSDPRRTIAAVAAAPGVLDSLFRTTLQLHNPGSAPLSGRLVFHPAGFSGTETDPSVTYSLAPGATTSYADVLSAFGRTGLGSLDIVATTGPAPLAVARVFNDGGVRGTTGFSVDAARPEDALQAGETGVLIAPADPAAARFNLGLRTFDAGATLSVTIRDKDGATIRTFTKVYAPSYFEQQAGSVFLGAAPGPSESVAIAVTAGSAIVYGASTDNKTQDPAIQIARAVRP